jgi:MFS transporter, DHA2 family, methylenomycin A resistance protein
MGLLHTSNSPRRGGWIPLVAVGLSYFMVIMDATAVNLALPALGRDLGGGVSVLQWVLDAYTLTFAALLLTAGAAGDRFGPKRVFMGGLVLFTAASAGCGAAPTAGALVAIRAIQGCAAAALVPASLALLHASYPDRAGRARAVGLWGAMGGMAAASGPLLGGALTAAASWRLVFGVNVPAGMIALVLTSRWVASPAGHEGRRLDPLGQVTAIVSLTALTGALIEGGPRGWSSPLVLGGLGLAAAAALAFVAAERRAASPMLPAALLTRPTFPAGTGVGFLINLGQYGQLFAFSLYLQQVRGKSPLAAGAAMLPEVVLLSLASAVSGRLTGRHGPRTTMLVGLTLGGAGLLGQISAGRATPLWLLAFPLAATGAGMALTMPAATSAVMESAPASYAGLASGLINTSRQVGSAIGVAIAGALLGSVSTFVSGFRVAMAICGGAFLTGALVTAVFVERPAPRERYAEKAPAGTDTGAESKVGRR